MFANQTHHCFDKEGFNESIWTMKKLKGIKDYEEACSDPTYEGFIMTIYDVFSECMSTEETWKEIIYHKEVNEKEVRTIQKHHERTVEREVKKNALAPWLAERMKNFDRCAQIEVRCFSEQIAGKCDCAEQLLKRL